MSLVVARETDTWTVRLARPARANALSVELVEALHRVLDEAEAAAPTALVLRGNDRHFAAGFDLADLAAESDASLAYRFLRIGLLLERLAEAPFLTLAVVEGAAVGAGADLAAACDHRIGTDRASFRFPGAAFGVVLGTQRLAAVAGTHQALLGSRTVSAAEAERIGLLTRLEPDPDAAVGEIVHAWRATAPIARAGLLTQSRHHRPDTALAALARSVAVPGLRDRIQYFARDRSQESS